MLCFVTCFFSDLYFWLTFILVWEIAPHLTVIVCVCVSCVFVAA